MASLLRRRARSLLAVTTLVTGLVVAAFAAPAYAGVWSMKDDFENNPAGRWWIEDSDGLGWGSFNPTNGLAHGGELYANLYRRDPGWTSVARDVRLTPAQYHSANCVAQVWLQGNPGSRINVEVINPSTWTYLAFKQITLPADYSWVAVQTPSWRPGPIDVVFRTSVLGSNSSTLSRGKVDDLTVQCNWV